jgi:hypothetical protein
METILMAGRLSEPGEKVNTFLIISLHAYFSLTMTEEEG